MRTAVAFLFALLMGSAPAQALPAFPGAEGLGAEAKGGRGGKVLFVTNLANKGPGSLRACVEAKGPRTCIFRVDGDVMLDQPLEVRHPFLTVAGQTAPGDGIAVRHRFNFKSPFHVFASHVVIRHIRVRPGPSVRESNSVNCFQIGGVKGRTVTNVIIDHVSCSWATDQLLATNPLAERITVQWSLLYEGLHRSTHTKGPHSKGPNLRACGVTMANNLIAHNVDRNPNVTCGNDKGGSGQVNLVNNVIYNGQDALLDLWNSRGPSWINLVGNSFIGGPNTRIRNEMPYGVDAWDVRSRNIVSGTTSPQFLCLQNNVGERVAGVPGAPDGSRPDAVHGVLNPNDAHLVASTDCQANPVGSQGLRTTVRTAGTAYDLVLARAGAAPWARDAADRRVVDTVRWREGRIVDHPNEVGGWPVLTSGVPPRDEDRDGMADSWEVRKGLNPSNPFDRNGDRDGDGYTNLEEYLAALAVPANR